MPLIKHNVLICKRLRDFRGNKIHTKFMDESFFQNNGYGLGREEYDAAVENLITGFNGSNSDFNSFGII